MVAKTMCFVFLSPSSPLLLLLTRSTRWCINTRRAEIHGQIHHQSSVHPGLYLHWRTCYHCHLDTRLRPSPFCHLILSASWSVDATLSTHSDIRGGRRRRVCLYCVQWQTIHSHWKDNTDRWVPQLSARNYDVCDLDFPKNLNTWARTPSFGCLLYCCS